MNFKLEKIGHGVEIEVDLRKLIEKIYIAPSAPNWLADLVRAVVKKYGFEFEVEHSRLSEKPGVSSYARSTI